MKALITNDDGVESTGIRVLAVAALRAGIEEVVIAAPSWDSSGASASLTAVQEDGRFLVSAGEVEGFTGEVYAVEGAPAFITRAALHGAFGDPPDLVLSGVNRGLNTGYAVIHSGTVGAATTAAIHGTPAIAFSVDGHEGAHWETVDAIIDAVLKALGRDPEPGLLLNVNIPDLPLAELRGLRQAPLASRGAVSTTVTEVGEGYITLEESEPGPAEPGTDAALIVEGYATFTPLRPTCESADVTPDGLLSVLRAGVWR
ncbi:MAG: 5'/3'-nucleotidase SurE [Acidimicrobiia bacterium]|nr:5'/3'-nucleotidase SurE [Acidimicrobiia bacterium]